jgi:hypothetical protein
VIGARRIGRTVESVGPAHSGTKRPRSDTSLLWDVHERRARSELSPHQPHFRRAVRKLLRVDDLESMPTVERNVALPLRLKVGGKTIGIAPAQNRGQNFGGESVPLPVGMGPLTFEVPVRLRWVHFRHLGQNAMERSTLSPAASAKGSAIIRICSSEKPQASGGAHVAVHAASSVV